MGTWNAGQGALAVIDKENVDEFIRLASQFGLQAKAAGEIIKNDSPSVRIKSQFSGKDIIFE